MDIVLCNSTLEHVVNVEIALGEFSRVLRPGGYLLITVPSINFEQMLFRYRLSGWFGKQTASRLARAKSARMSHLHYLHPTMWEEHLVRSSLSTVSWRPIVPSAVVAWGDLLQMFRDAGIGGAQTSLHQPSRRLDDIAFRLIRRFCIELELGIALIADGHGQGEIAKGAGGAYLIVAQHSSVAAAKKVANSGLTDEVDGLPLLTITA
jgi:hypothetical protein